MLGTGRAVVTGCYNTCFVLHEEERYFLVDGGGGIGLLSRLKSAGIEWSRVRNMFVTHRHMDHIMGMLWMIRMICQAAKRGEYEGEARIYGHEEVSPDPEGSLLHAPLGAGEPFHWKGSKADSGGRRGREGDHRSQSPFFSISIRRRRSSSALPWICRRMTGSHCCGDEPYNDSEKEYVQGSRWLLHEAFCLYRDADRFRPYEKHHSTVKDACGQAENLEIRNLILYHTEDTDMANRKRMYTEEGKQYFSGNLYVPDDLETI